MFSKKEKPEKAPEEKAPTKFSDKLAKEVGEPAVPAKKAKAPAPPAPAEPSTPLALVDALLARHRDGSEIRRIEIVELRKKLL